MVLSHPHNRFTFNLYFLITSLTLMDYQFILDHGDKIGMVGQNVKLPLVIKRSYGVGLPDKNYPFPVAY